MENETIRHTSGDHVCWTRKNKNGDVTIYTRDPKLKSDICMADVKCFDIITNPFDDETVPVCQGDELMIAVMKNGYALLTVDTELEGFTILWTKKCGKFKA